MGSWNKDNEKEWSKFTKEKRSPRFNFYIFFKNIYIIIKYWIIALQKGDRQKDERGLERKDRSDDKNKRIKFEDKKEKFVSFSFSLSFFLSFNIL